MDDDIYLDRYRLFLFNGNKQCTPNTFRLYASDNLNAWNNPLHNSWEIIDERIDINNWSDDVYKEFKVHNLTKKYRLFALVIHKIQNENNGAVNFTQMEIIWKGFFKYI